jgi:hypothetical protein
MSKKKEKKQNNPKLHHLEFLETLGFTNFLELPPRPKLERISEFNVILQIQHLSHNVFLEPLTRAVKVTTNMEKTM